MRETHATACFSRKGPQGREKEDNNNLLRKGKKKKGKTEKKEDRARANSCEKNNAWKKKGKGEDLAKSSRT